MTHPASVLSGRRLRAALVFLAFFAPAVLVTPAQAINAPCVVFSSGDGTFGTGYGAYAFKKIAVSYGSPLKTVMCARTASMGVSACAAVSGTIVNQGTMFSFSANCAHGFHLPTAPTAMFNCGECGTVTLDGSDGLPVELLTFGIE